METNPLVSILMPLYNAENYIREAVLSVCHQTYNNWELIIVDDGSTDNSAEILAPIIEADVRIKFVKQQHGGGCVARNTALQLAHGDYFQYLDADDYLHPNKIECQIKEYEKYDNPSEILLFGTCLVHTLEDINIPSSMTKLYKDYIPGITALIEIWKHHFNSFPYSSYLIPRQMSICAGEWNAKLVRSQDTDYIARILKQAKKLIYVPEAIFYYRQVPGSISRRKLTMAQLESEMIVCNNIADIILSESQSTDAVFACSTHYTDILTAWYPKNKLLVDDIMANMKSRGLEMNFANRGTLFHIINLLFGWKVAVQMVKMKNQILRR